MGAPIRNISRRLMTTKITISFHETDLDTADRSRRMLSDREARITKASRCGRRPLTTRVRIKTTREGSDRMPRFITHKASNWVPTSVRHVIPTAAAKTPETLRFEPRILGTTLGVIGNTTVRRPQKEVTKKIGLVGFFLSNKSPT